MTRIVSVSQDTNSGNVYLRYYPSSKNGYRNVVCYSDGTMRVIN